MDNDINSTKAENTQMANLETLNVSMFYLEHKVRLPEKLAISQSIYQQIDSGQHEGHTQITELEGATA